jgi:hypothetical protein
VGAEQLARGTVRSGSAADANESGGSDEKLLASPKSSSSRNSSSVDDIMSSES